MESAASKMIDAAERIVAEQGLAALTVHAVQAAAGQRNRSAVQYHFGGRQGLLEAVIAARMNPANERRTAMLLALDGDVTVRDLVEVMIVPLAEPVLARRPSYWARFLLQALSDPATSLAAMAKADHDALRIAQSRLEARLDHLEPSVRTLRASSMFAYACVVLAACEVGTVPAELRADVVLTELVDACCGLVGAPSTSAPSAGRTRQRAGAQSR